MIQRGSLRPCVVPRFSLLVIFRAFFCEFLAVDLRHFSLGFDRGCMHEHFAVLFLVIPPKSMCKGARFWGFPKFWESGVLGGKSFDSS
jgi:hypothetical protein